MKKYAATARLCATDAFDGGLLTITGTWLLRLITLLVMLAVWRALITDGADTAGLTLGQVLTYAVLSSVLSEQLNIVSPASLAFWEGTLATRYARPLSVVFQLMAETIGRWIPHFLFYTIPTLIIIPFFGILLMPASLLSFFSFLFSLLLAISLGFAMDLLFAAIAIHIKNAGWMALYIRNAFFTLFSGSLIPFDLLPWGMGSVFRLLPFGSLASAPLTLFTGMSEPLPTLLLQVFWNTILWPIAWLVFHKSEEKMVAYGG